MSGPPEVDATPLQHDALKDEDPSLRGLVEAEAVRELASNLAGDGAAWLSRAVHTEVALLHCLEAVQHLPVPNRFRTEAVCALWEPGVTITPHLEGGYRRALLEHKQCRAHLHAMVKNSYSSGRNDDRLSNPNGKNYPQPFREDTEDPTHESKANILGCHQYSAVGQMNLSTILVENIRSHDYFKGLHELSTFEEVVALEKRRPPRLSRHANRVPAWLVGPAERWMQFADEYGRLYFYDFATGQRASEITERRDRARR